MVARLYASLHFANDDTLILYIHFPLAIFRESYFITYICSKDSTVKYSCQIIDTSTTKL